ncbi:hypothetical protein BJ508DRAFT_329319 [Ascobolus immersus RN42]|uniref:F-box domain-containing protein n=1 Tax=Ascobolus immersus RN42 TaxID=1160509 RepID=A0A3N4HYW3_ASCIM|nr:hypothetical protein BJ508DRAFT_329319 [Ascobolus immersus RN42]
MSSNKNPLNKTDPDLAPTVHLLSLPLELRLEIYRQCTAFTLLNLSHANTRLRNEVNNEPAIFTSAYGYYTSPTTHPPSAVRARRLRPHNTTIFTIKLITRLLDITERNLLLKLFHGKIEDTRICMACYRVCLLDEIAVSYRGLSHISPERCTSLRTKYHLGHEWFSV